MEGVDRDRPAVARVSEETDEEGAEELPRYERASDALPEYQGAAAVGDEGEAPRYVEAAEEGTERRTRDHFWWGVEGGAGGIA